MTSAIESPAKPPPLGAAEPGPPVASLGADVDGLPGDVVAPGPAAFDFAYPPSGAAERAAGAAADAAADDAAGEPLARFTEASGRWAAEAEPAPFAAQLSAYAGAPGGDPAAEAGKAPPAATNGAQPGAERERRVGAVAARRRVVRRDDERRERRHEPAADPESFRPAAGYTIDDIACFAGDGAAPERTDTRSESWPS